VTPAASTPTVAKVAFAALVLATFAAFFVAQGLKSTPPVIQELGIEPPDAFSPNQDGRFERVRVGFELKEGDRVDLSIVDRNGDRVRELVENRRVEAGERVSAKWDGRDDEGERVPDGTYRPRVVLRRQGRSVVVPRNISLDTTPPEPRVLSIGPQRDTVPRPELLPKPDGEPASITISAPGSRPEVDIWRTSPGVRRVTGLDVPPLVDGRGKVTWSGQRRGRRVAPGTFVVVVRSRDRAGNIGASVPEPLRPRRGMRLPGRGGISIRYLAAQPPLVPIGAGRPLPVAVDARGQTFNWSLRRIGERTPVKRSRRAQGGEFVRDAPRGKSGLFVFEARTRTKRTQVPVAIDDARNQRVLVVVPATTWQGRNPVDDDGDGLPNVLDLGTPVRLERVFAEGLPRGFEQNEGALFAHLHRQGYRYDLTTDVGLATGRGPKLAGHGGVLIAGDAVWLTEDVRRELRAFVARGGTLASLGTGALRGEVRQTARRLLDPTPVGPTDLFGARIGPVQRERVDLTILEDDDNVQLFAGEEGLFEDVDAFEATLSPGAEARRIAAAVTDDDQAREVIFAARFGEGLIVRPGIPEFPTRLNSDPASAELMGRIWTLLRTG
jgi:hypothetical protein